MGGDVTYTWGATSEWIKFNKPDVVKKTIKWSKKLKNGLDKAANATPWVEVPAGGVTEYNTTIPHTESRLIDGVSRDCEVRYRKRKYFKYTRTSAQKKKKKCTKHTYVYYVYKKQWADKPVEIKEYSRYEDGVEYIYFADHYYDEEGELVNTTGHLPHPSNIQMSYSDVRRNFDSEANNSDSRDNSGTYVLANVRANVVTLEMSWTGLSEEAGAELIDTLNPQLDTAGNYPYLIVQYRDLATGKAKTGTFFAGDRAVEKYANGLYKEISVTLTEV